MFIEILESLLDANNLDIQDSELEIFANNEEDDKSYLIPPYDHFDKVPDWVLGTATVVILGGGGFLWWTDRKSKT